MYIVNLVREQFMYDVCFSSRNYDAELYACSHRFNEKLELESLRRAMTDGSFLNQIVKQRKEAGR
jgi:hypothetical protein